MLELIELYNKEIIKIEYTLKHAKSKIDNNGELTKSDVLRINTESVYDVYTDILDSLETLNSMKY